MKTVRIIAFETGNDPQAITFRLGIFDKTLNSGDKIVAAVKKACETYVRTTQRGQEEYRPNGNNFNWGDLANSDIDMTPSCRDNEFCILPDDNTETIAVNLNEQLVAKN